jgi:hypothetical protein
MLALPTVQFGWVGLVPLSEFIFVMIVPDLQGALFFGSLVGQRVAVFVPSSKLTGQEEKP